MHNSLEVSSDTTSATDLHFITRHRDVLTRLARRSYTHDGRGVIVINYHQTSNPAMTYLSYREIAELSDSESVHTLMQHMQQYDPPCEVLCLGMHASDIAHAYRVQLTDTTYAPLSMSQPIIA